MTMLWLRGAVGVVFIERSVDRTIVHTLYGYGMG